MAIGNFANCNRFTRAREGGDVNDPRDPGGLTSRGVTAAAGAEYRRKRGLAFKAVTAWSEAEVSDFYRAAYWGPAGCEHMVLGVDLAVYDGGVNSGVSRSLGWYRSIPAALDPVPFIKALCAKRLGFLHALKTWKHFGKGWGARVAMVEATAVGMFLVGTKAPNAKAALLAEADDAHKDAVNGAKGAAVTGGGATASPFVLPTDHLGLWIVGAVAVVGLGFAVWLVIRAANHNARADAYRTIASGVRS